MTVRIIGALLLETVSLHFVLPADRLTTKSNSSLYLNIAEVHRLSK
jgi:hypothetical protein